MHETFPNKNLNKIDANSDSYKKLEEIYQKAIEYIEHAKHNVQRVINTEMVQAYWLIGREIVEEEQQGKDKADYGSYLLNNLAKRLTEKYGRGFSISTMRDSPAILSCLQRLRHNSPRSAWRIQNTI